MTLQDNISKNKGKALYITGVILAAMFKQLFEGLSKYLPVDTWWGDGLAIIFGYIIIAVSLIAPLLFGNDPEIQRVKGERKTIGEALNDTKVENEGLRIKCALQDQLLEENKIIPIKYRVDGTYGVKEKLEMDTTLDEPEKEEEKKDDPPPG